MPPSQVKDGHLSIYQVLSKMGFSHPGKVWKHLLAQHGPDFVLHTRMQFDMADGRKGRLVPAIRQEDLGKLLEQVRQMNPEMQSQWFFLPEEQQVIDFLMDAFADQEPESPCMVQDVMVDLFFHRCKLAVVLVSAAEPETQRIQKLQQDGVQVVHANVYHKDFRPGTLFREIRGIIDLKT
ncbi:hypothetical protein [Deinococcus cellulosilyticus]|uniref:Uncharacterized protein n=1 Tax=Deinococcus cellulosilyticus (strain DSM 18568 / NBRC 106333 / KACC 11606 / 5516J-15) TaxID=1223518 RepID=A0A511NC10_DEIC1|nr:hypothetical protein [Deinococcus cellulosilyticus]GEM50106.1 hypothetical protein DC3_57410 [Deinococcus cellulosilyticus NBRC 106333 = KACC 11606]